MITTRTGRPVATFAWVAASLTLIACAANPGWRGKNVSDADEIAQGREAAVEVEKYIGFAGSEELNAYVDRIGQRLVAHSGRSHLKHEFHVVDMPEPNAFALPGGFIYVTRGLLALLNGEDELAAILGHEIAHVAARHSVQRQAASRRWIPLQILAGIGGAAASVVSPELGQVVAGVGQLPAAIRLAKYSRDQEREADRLGQEYAAAEGWDPAALASSMDALTREQELAGGRPERGTFFDSHPTTPDRSRDGRAYAATLTVGAANRIAPDRTAFLKRLDGMVLGPAAKAGVFLDNRFVHPDLDFVLSFPKGWVYQNAPTVVLAHPKDESAVIGLQVAAEGGDPASVADKFHQEISLLERSEPKTINGLPAVTGTARVVDRGEEVFLSLGWIAKDGIVYQLLGAAPSKRWQANRPRFSATIASFRAPSQHDLQKVHENRLRLVQAQPEETLTAVAKRSESRWTVAKMAAVNAMAAASKLEGNETVKISKRERYNPPVADATGEDPAR